MADDIVVVGVGGHVLGLDAATGARRWRFDFPQARDGELVRLAVAGEMVYALVPRRLVCIHRATGRVLGQVETAEIYGYSGGTLLAEADRILVATSNMVQCFSSDGRLLWRDDLAGLAQSMVALAVGDRVAQADEK